MSNYGLQYMGSKARIIEKISKFFPNADHFYDLFGGGFSVTHYMMEKRRNSFKTFHYNEIRKITTDLVKDAISGKYNYKVFKPEWISRDRFEKEKDTSAYIKYLWSFGNNGRTYIFGKKREQDKKSMHMAVVFDEFDDNFKKLFKISSWPKNMSITDKRLFLKKIIKSRKELEQLEQLEQLERLQRLEQLEITSLSYDQVEIKNNSVIYCDIPYKGTASYGLEFDYDKFFNWADAQENPVFISEYNIDDKRFHILKEFSFNTAFANSLNSKLVERLYGNKKAHEIINNYLKNRVK